MSATLKAGHNAKRDQVWSMPLDSIDVSDPVLHRDDTVGYYFERLREQAPVHLTNNERFGKFWSVTRYADIMAVDIDHETFSSPAKTPLLVCQCHSRTTVALRS
jgi:cytochrome P450